MRSCRALRLMRPDKILYTADNTESRLAPFLLQIPNKIGVFKRCFAKRGRGHARARQEGVDFGDKLLRRVHKEEAIVRFLYRQ